MITPALITTSQDFEAANYEAAESRSGVYRLLSALFLKEADPGLLAALREENISTVLREVAPDIFRFLNDGGAENRLDELAEEYAALFLVPGGLSPHESVRLNGMLNQKPAADVEDFFRRCGLVIREGSSILPDHLGMELDFMGFLALKETDARRNGKEEDAGKWLSLQGEFFRGHIGTWAFDFLRDLRRYAFHPFYQGVGSLTERFLETERDYFASLEEVKKQDVAG